MSTALGGQPFKVASHARGRHRLCPPGRPIPEMTVVVRRHGLCARMAISCSSRRPRSSLPMRSSHVARANTPGRMESIAGQPHQQTARQRVELPVSSRPRRILSAPGTGPRRRSGGRCAGAEGVDQQTSVFTSVPCAGGADVGSQCHIVDAARRGDIGRVGTSSRRSPHALGTSRETHRRSPAVVPRACHRATVSRAPSKARRRRYRRTVARTESSGTALSGGVSRGERRQVA